MARVENMRTKTESVILLESFLSVRVEKNISIVLVRTMTKVFSRNITGDTVNLRGKKKRDYSDCDARSVRFYRERGKGGGIVWHWGLSEGN